MYYGVKRFKDQMLYKILQMCGGDGGNKTQIVYCCNINFHTVVPYLNRLIRNALAERTDAEIVRYQTTVKGAEALRHMQELERLMPKMASEGDGAV